MVKVSINKMPTAKTVARHYAEGRYSDYPTDAVLSAVNTFDYDYNPTAVPFKIGFQQTFYANFKAFVYLSRHNSEEEIKRFLDNPDGFCSEVGVELGVPFDEISPKIFAAMVEEQMLETIKTGESFNVLIATRNKSVGDWGERHREKFPSQFMRRECLHGLRGVPPRLEAEEIEAAGFGASQASLGVMLAHIIGHFSDSGDI